MFKRENSNPSQALTKVDELLSKFRGTTKLLLGDSAVTAQKKKEEVQLMRAELNLYTIPFACGRKVYKHEKSGEYRIGGWLEKMPTDDQLLEMKKKIRAFIEEVAMKLSPGVMTTPLVPGESEIPQTLDASTTADPEAVTSFEKMNSKTLEKKVAHLLTKHFDDEQFMEFAFNARKVRSNDKKNILLYFLGGAVLLIGAGGVIYFLRREKNDGEEGEDYDVAEMPDDDESPEVIIDDDIPTASFEMASISM